MNTKRLVTLSLFLSMSIVLSIVESFIPSISIPGAKLGLANIMTLVILNLYGEKDAFLIVILRIFLVGLLRGTIGSPAFFLSLSGGLMAYLLMVAFLKMKVFSIVGVSGMGSLGHSLGQVLMAIVILSVPQLVYYFPLLFLIDLSISLSTEANNSTGSSVSCSTILVK